MIFFLEFQQKNSSDNFWKIFSRNFLRFLEEIENGRIEKMNYGYREQKLSELGVNDKTFEQA